MPIRFLQEIVLGLDIGVRIWFNRKRCIGCIVTSPPYFMACICVFFVKLSRIPYLFDVRDRYPRVLMDLEVVGSSHLLYRILEWLEAWMYKDAQMITTVTEGLAAELRTGFTSKEFHLLRNGFDESIFTGELIETPKRTAFTVVYHGRLGRFYDLDTYLEIIKMVYNADSSIQFLMVGDLPQSICANASPNLEILPAMKLEKLAKVLASCHLGICLLRELPAMTSAFPAKAYDYIGAGIPVLVGPRGELTQMVDRFNIGTTFEKISAKEVADTILRLKNDEEVWTKMCAHVKKCRMNFG
ncbi:MAG: glycosyltransferase, partial [Opitutae bacterium]